MAIGKTSLDEDQLVRLRAVMRNVRDGALLLQEGVEVVVQEPPPPPEVDHESDAVTESTSVQSRTRRARRSQSVTLKELHRKMARPLSPLPARRSAKQQTSNRRVRRWENLNTLVRENEITEEDVVPAQRARTTFEVLLDSPGNMELWNSFLRASEERQQELLAPRSRPAPKPSTSPIQCYKRIDRATRRLIRKCNNVPVAFLQLLEEDIERFVLGTRDEADAGNAAGATAADEEWVTISTSNAQAGDDKENEEDDGCKHRVETGDGSLVWALDDAFGRSLAHAVCQYYCLTSYSKDIGGMRVTRVLRPATVLARPSQTLSAFLATFNEDSS